MAGAASNKARPAYITLFFILRFRLLSIFAVSVPCSRHQRLEPLPDAPREGLPLETLRDTPPLETLRLDEPLETLRLTELLEVLRLDGLLETLRVVPLETLRVVPLETLRVVPFEGLLLTVRPAVLRSD